MSLRGFGDGFGWALQAAIEDTDSDDDGVGAAGGPDGVRHQAAVAEARGHLGGGGKRGWVE